MHNQQDKIRVIKNIGTFIVYLIFIFGMAVMWYIEIAVFDAGPIEHLINIISINASVVQGFIERGQWSLIFESFIFYFSVVYVVFDVFKRIFRFRRS